jgi:hypothetical protein
MSYFRLYICQHKYMYIYYIYIYTYAATALPVDDALDDADMFL